MTVAYDEIGTVRDIKLRDVRKLCTERIEFYILLEADRRDRIIPDAEIIKVCIVLQTETSKHVVTAAQLRKFGILGNVELLEFIFVTFQILKLRILTDEEKEALLAQSEDAAPAEESAENE